MAIYPAGEDQHQELKRQPVHRSQFRSVELDDVGRKQRLSDRLRGRIFRVSCFGGLLAHYAQGHTYNKFYGYKLTVLRLESGNGEVSHVVLRSKEKQYGVN